MKPWLGAAVSLLIALAAVAVTYGQTTEKVTNLEKRQVEDRASQKADVTEVKQDVKSIATDVQTILRKLVEMEATQRAERRERSSR